MPWCNVGRGRLAASVFGDPSNPPVLLMAGGGGAMWSWARLLPEVWPVEIAPVESMSPLSSLATRFRVAVYDQAGVGQSADVAPATSADEAASDGRCRNEAAFARLGGAAPLPATSGQSQDRHRLNRSGDRQLNNALFTVALSRARSHQPTRDYRDRRRSEGKTDREIRRCLKRYIARRVWRLLEHPPGTEIAA